MFARIGECAETFDLCCHRGLKLKNKNTKRVMVVNEIDGQWSFVGMCVCVFWLAVFCCLVGFTPVQGIDLAEQHVYRANIYATCTSQNEIFM